MLTTLFAVVLAVAGVDHPLRDPTLLFAVCFAGIIVIEPTRDRLLGWVEAKLSPRLQKLRSLRQEYTRRIPELHDADHVAQVLGDTLQAALTPRGGCVFLNSGGEWRPAYPFGSDAPAQLTLVPDALDLLGSESLKQLADTPEAQLDDERPLRRAGVEVAAALARSGETLGLLLFTSSGSGVPYNSLELDFVVMAVGHATMALHNARVARELVATERRATTGRTALAVAHDLGKDLGLIRMLAKRLPNRLGDPARARRDLTLIRELAEELTETVRGFVRDATAPIAEEPGSACFDDTVARAVRAMSRIHGPERIIQCIEPRLRAVRTHENLERVLLNLLDNALLASAKSDSVRVFATLEENTIRITVTDRGCGIAPENRDAAFQLGFTTREQRGGFGVGLAVSREITEALGGSIELTPNPGGGTVAVVRIPVGSHESA